MMHFEAAIATATEAVLLGERSQEACADSPMLDRRVVDKVLPEPALRSADALVELLEPALPLDERVDPVAVGRYRCVGVAAIDSTDLFLEGVKRGTAHAPEVLAADDPLDAGEATSARRDPRRAVSGPEY